MKHVAQKVTRQMLKSVSESFGISRDFDVRHTEKQVFYNLYFEETFLKIKTSLSNFLLVFMIDNVFWDILYLYKCVTM